MREPVPLRNRIGRVKAHALLRLFQFIEFVFHSLFASSVASEDRCVANAGKIKLEMRMRKRR
jgi:hypothetical protein